MTEFAIPNATALSGWRKSSYSGNEGGSCVEVTNAHPTAVPVRDSKNPHGPALLIPPAAWTSFISAIKQDTLPN